MIIWLMYFVIVWYNILDVYQTNMLFQCGSYEANPLLMFFMRNSHDILTIIIIKVFILVWFGIFVFIYNKKETKYI